MAKHHGKIIIAHIAEALGLDPKNVRSLTIRMAIDEAVTVVVEGYADIEDAKEFRELFEEFWLVDDKGLKIGPMSRFREESQDAKVHA